MLKPRNMQNVLYLLPKEKPTFHRFIGKIKVLNNSWNRFVYNFYPQSILVLEECLKSGEKPDIMPL